MPNRSGLCPKCGQTITPITCQVNKALRRDVLKCPNCRARILPCRTPGCSNYAQGGKVWDSEFCPDCTKSIAHTGFSVLLTIPALAAAFRRRSPWGPMPLGCVADRP